MRYTHYYVRYHKDGAWRRLPFNELHLRPYHGMQWSDAGLSKKDACALVDYWNRSGRDFGYTYSIGSDDELHIFIVDVSKLK